MVEVNGAIGNAEHVLADHEFEFRWVSEARSQIS